MQSRAFGNNGPFRTILLTRVVTITMALGAAMVPVVSAQRDASGISEQTPSPRHDGPPALFRSSVNLVSVSAVVRDRRGRVVPSLRGADFEILDAGVRRAVVDVRADSNAPASIALLVDGSGSMGLGAAQALTQRISEDLLATLNTSRDSAALLSFDTRLLTLCGFTRDFARVRGSLNDVEAFGSTSLYDAVAGSAALVAERTRNRRAVIVLTDGLDNASTFSPQEVAWIASTIDVPVYLFDVGDQPAEHPGTAAASRGSLAELAEATGGAMFVANTPERIAKAVKRVSDELRHQYLIAFESAANAGLRRVEVRMRKSSLRVQARNWYQVEN